MRNWNYIEKAGTLSLTPYELWRERTNGQAHSTLEEWDRPTLLTDMTVDDIGEIMQEACLGNATTSKRAGVSGSTEVYPWMP